MFNFYEHVKADPIYFKQFTCKDLLFLNYDCPIKVKKADHWAEHNYFMYVLTGKKILHSPNKSWTLESGTAVFVKKGACMLEQFFYEPFCLLVFFVPDSYICSFIKENISVVPLVNASGNALNDLVFPIKVNAVLTAFYESVLPYFSMEKDPPENLVEIKFRELLLNIISNSANNDLITYFRSLSSEPVINFRQVMESNCLYNLQLNEYARLCNRSLSSFKRDFHSAFQASPGKWLLEKKLAHASHLLLTTEKTISDISFESGFENSTHFSRVFKKRFNYPPLQYRRQSTQTFA